jgi:hypothetical protein
VRLATLVAVAHQSGLLQHAEMFRDRRLRDPGAGRQRRDGQLAVAAQPFEQGSPGRIGERPEQQVVGVRHQRSITRWLWINA